MTPVQWIKVVKGGKIQMTQSITHIGFDADDTLWRCEDLFFRRIRGYKTFADRLIEDVINAVYEWKDNLELYGYGVKSFTLSFGNLLNFERLMAVEENCQYQAFLDCQRAFES